MKNWRREVNDDRIDDEEERWTGYHFDSFSKFHIDNCIYAPGIDSQAIVHAILLLSDRIQETNEILKKIERK